MIGPGTRPYAQEQETASDSDFVSVTNACELGQRRGFDALLDDNRSLRPPPPSTTSRHTTLHKITQSNTEQRNTTSAQFNTSQRYT